MANGKRRKRGPGDAPRVKLTPLFVTHHREHADELVGEILFRLYAERVIPGISTAPVEYLPAGTDTYEGMNGDQAFERGIVCLGVCGGPFDEHPRNGMKRGGKSTVTLVFEWLQEEELLSAEEVAAWMEIVEAVDKNDQTGASNPLDIFRTIASLYRSNKPDAIEAVRTLVDIVVRVTFEQNLRVFTTSKAEFDKGEHTEVLVGNRMVKVSVVESDDDSVIRYTLSPLSGQPAIFVQRQSDGHFQVHARKAWVEGKGLTVRNIVAALRRREAEILGIPEPSPFEQTMEGKVEVDGLEGIYYQREAERIFNGSLSNLGEPLLKTPWPAIVRIVKENISFDPDRARPRNGNGHRPQHQSSQSREQVRS